ncbi:ABC-2 type transporter [Catenulispora acidiphila DSM 44928]|uniref:Transport permease protein n=1 Tax=Catenulispora acidiphila (strain DSM 44928 / JCM 14897 / NBRC 102108 / NRRL B-24433 / ID139908) TaxID=479433 RepID=C7Q8P2_CATAD|nr:ABC transporter permease [Catenulispora acidiphila]ACU70307.1 ABC-2 type transporter [Catenulispora acidiphila DSM 44928]
MTTATVVAAGTTAAAPKPFKTIRHSAALAKRSLIKTMRTPEALLDVTLQPVIFLLLFTYVFGGAIAGSQSVYLQYLLPGILAQTIAMSATAIGVNMNTDISKGVFDRFRSLPIARSAPLVGAVLADFVRYALVAVITLTVGYAMGFRIHTNPLEAGAALLVSVAFALALSWVSVFLGMLARTPGAVQGMMILLVLPLSFGSNTFVQTNTLPGWMQAFVNVNPITHLAGVSRGLFLGGPVATHMLWTFGWIVGLTAVFMPLALRAYGRKV